MCEGKNKHHTCHCCDNDTCHDEHHHEVEEENSSFRDWFLIIFSIVLLVYGIFANPFPTAEWLIFVIAYLPISIPIIKEAWEEIREGDIFNEFTLMLIATIGAFAIKEYPEAVAVLLFYRIGEYFQDKAVGRAHRDIQELVNLRPDVVTVITKDGDRIEKKPEEVQIGEEIEVIAGGRVPLDGKLLTSHADFNTAALTGESLPRSIFSGEEVQAGMIAAGKVIRLKVVRPASESTLSRILSMVEDAAQRKSPSEMFIRRFARIYTPIVIGLALLVAIIPPIAFQQEWNAWLYRALIFLVVSCPCALVISIPLCYFRGIGEASRKGILFKGGNYLDAVTKLRTIVFDKTGTLTQGRFTVSKITTTKNSTAIDLLTKAAILEKHSTHPIAQAIVSAVPNLINTEATEIEEIAGLGLRGNIDGKTVLVGKPTLLRQENIEIVSVNETIQEEKEKISEKHSLSQTEKLSLPIEQNEYEGYTCVFVAENGIHIGTIALSDAAKPDAEKAISQLQSIGIEQTCMLSGDRSTVVKSLANKLGINEAYGDLMPTDKAAYLQKIKEKAGKGATAFVGDGINDAPVLAMSDVGFAMGGSGSDMAIETADIVLQSDNPLRIADAIRIGRNTRCIANVNIFFSLFFKVIVLLLSAMGFVGLWIAVLADTGVALLCVANTYFIKQPHD